MDLGIAAMSTYMASSKSMHELSIGLMKKAMDQVEETGDQIVEMLQTTQVPPTEGGIIDISL